MVMSQREAVFSATTTTLASNGVEFTPGTTVIHDVVTKEIRHAIVERVCDMFTEGQVEFKATESNAAKLANASELRKYVNGLVTNWFNKDKMLNGGAKYEAKNPGSRTGSSDEKLSELRNLKKVLVARGEDDETVAKVDAAIEARLAEIEAAKPKASKKLPSVNVDALPEELRALLVA